MSRGVLWALVFFVLCVIAGTVALIGALVTRSDQDIARAAITAEVRVEVETAEIRGADLYHRHTGAPAGRLARDDLLHLRLAVTNRSQNRVIEYTGLVSRHTATLVDNFGNVYRWQRMP